MHDAHNLFEYGAETKVITQPETQCARLLEHFRSGGTITSLESTLEFGITQLARCIDDLQKEGHRFNKDWEVTETGKHIKRYKLLK